MAKAQKKAATQHLTGEFEGVIMRRSETGALTVDLSALNGVNVRVIMNGNRAVKVNSAGEQTVINASVDKRAYKIGKCMPEVWAYVGVGKDGKDVFAKDYGLVQRWKEAMEFAKGEGAHLGSDAELDLLQEAINEGPLGDSFYFRSGPFDLVWGSRRGPYGPGDHARVRRLGGGDRDSWLYQGRAASTVLFLSLEPGVWPRP